MSACGMCCPHKIRRERKTLSKHDRADKGECYIGGNNAQSANEGTGSGQKRGGCKTNALRCIRFREPSDSPD
jgi:hypothetical protein